jgi:hypothetical protein
MSDELRDFEIVEGEVSRLDGPPDVAALGIDLPADKDEAIRVLLEELHSARGEASSYLDDLRRVAADFDNFRKRATREQQVTVERASERVLAAMLPVLDSFDAALQISPTTETEEKLLGGMRSTHAQLMDASPRKGSRACRRGASRSTPRSTRRSCRAVKAPS